MKNIKETKSILTALYVTNRVVAKNKEIDHILEYAFRSLFDSNTNTLGLCTIGQNEESIKIAVDYLLEQDTCGKFKPLKGDK